MAKRPKYSEFVSPIGVAQYAYIAKPQDPYQGKGDPTYKVTVLLEDTDENRAWCAKVIDTLQAEAKTNGVKLKKQFANPFIYPEDVDEDDFIPAAGKDKPKYGEIYRDKIFFVTKSKFQPAQIDTARQALPEDVKIMGGDTIRVKVEGNPYDTLQTGIGLRLKVVQLVEKNTSFSRGTNTDGFDDIDGYRAPDEAGDDDEEGPEQF